MVDRQTSIMNSQIHERRFQDEIPFWKEQRGYLYGLGMQELAQKASYQFYRRMLFYYVDFRDRGMKDSGRQLVEFLRSEKTEVKRIYQKSYVAIGDKVRMRIALLAPDLYYLIVKIYDKVIIPLRNN